MKKIRGISKMVCFLSMLLTIANPLSVLAAQTSEDTQLGVSIQMITEEDSDTDEQNKKDNPNKNDDVPVAPYEGEDFVYAKITHNEESHAVTRLEYDQFIKTLKGIGVLEEDFVPIEVYEVDEELERYRDYMCRYKRDTRNATETWTDLNWNEYHAFAAYFQPDEWQKTLLEYYTLAEIYSYYFGLGYSIDEEALGDKILFEKQAKEDPSLLEPATKIVEEEYKVVSLEYDLDSLYHKEKVYCIPLANFEQLDLLLEGCKPWTGEEDFKNPQNFVQGFVSWEMGTADRYMTTYRNISVADSGPILRYVQSNQIPKEKITDDCYLIRIRTKMGVVYYEKDFCLTQDAFFTLISDYFAQYSKTSPYYSGVNVNAQAVE